MSELARLQKKLDCALNGLPSEQGVAIQQATCPTHGAFTQYTRNVQVAGKSVLTLGTECPQCLLDKITKLEHVAAQKNHEKQEQKLKKLRANSGVGLRFAQASFQNYVPSERSHTAWTICQRYAQSWNERKATGGGLVLFGKTGTGKSHLACAIANHLMDSHLATVQFTTALRLTQDVKNTWRAGAEKSEVDVIKSYVSPELLIIDEVGVQYGSDSEKIILFEVINQRYENLKPTILISNLDERLLADYLGERVLDRMRDGSGLMIKFDWESYRK